MSRASAERTGHPATLGVQAHCLRTAAVADLIAHHLFLPTEQKNLLRDACLVHHRGSGLLAPQSAEKLLVHLCVGTSVTGLMTDPVPPEIRGILNAYEVPGVGNSLELQISAIIRLADAFDQAMEAQPIEDCTVEEILESLCGGVTAGLWSAEVMGALVGSTRPIPLRTPEAWKLPVFPQAAMRMIELIRGPFASLSQVAEAAGLDPATAGLLMQLANSALFGSRTRLSTLSQAVTRLGFATAHRVITTASLRSVFAFPKLQGLWPHSLEVADLAQQLGCRNGLVDPGEAYLAGLLHDVGRIALLSVPLWDSARLEGLTANGCPQLYAEDLLLRTNHAEIGSEIAEYWRLPEAMTSALQQHHRPENADLPLAHVLYLAEYLSAGEEDLPSIVRLEAALRGARLRWDDIRDFQVSPLGSWLAAA